jgi:predicted PurR-regulated permease PerM
MRARFSPGTADRALEMGAEVSDAVRRYFAVKTLTSLITGVATGLFTLAVGLDLSAIWGLLAFLLEYVPSVGSMIAVVPPALFAFLQFDGFARPLAITGGLIALQLVLGNYVDPKIEGRRMSVSPLVVLLSIVFWAWVWGPFGALLGVPITVTLTILARHFGGMRWAWALFTEESADPEKQPA